MASPLARWLATLDAAGLAEVLVRRPDAASPPPGSLGELAARLQEAHSVDAVLATLPLPAVQLVEAAQALGGPAIMRQALAEAVGRTADDPDLEAALHVLAQRALVWPDAEGRLRMAGALWSAFERPLGLGPPAELLLDAAPSAEIRDIARRLGLTADRTRGAVVEAVRRWLSDADAVRAVVAEAPAATRALLREMALHGPTMEAPQLFSPVGRRSTPELTWAVERGLLVWDGWQHAQMPYEVGLALRGADWHAPFDPRPPAMEPLEVDPAAVAQEAAAAAASAVAHLSALLDSCAGTPIALLKAGGVGARELRRLEKATGADEAVLRLLIEVAHAAGLLAVSGEVVLPTEAYDDWRAAEPADRLVPLLGAWRRLPTSTLMAPVLGGPTAPLRRESVGASPDLRPHLLRLLDELPEGTALATPAAAVALLRWRAPLLVEADELGEMQADAAWHEAGLLGVVAHGALSPLGRALHDEAALRAAAAELLPDSVGEALFQADLTAVVPGSPAASLAALLDSAADRESGGTAATWRFGSASVRRALDGGYAVAELLAQLRKVAVGGTLPQPLEYLIADVARRHGAVRVRPVGCVLRAEDPALLAEIAGMRALRPLRLTLLAPTVLASAGSVKDTLAALRTAGFAPVREDADGAAVLERAPVHRAPPQRRHGRTGPTADARAATPGVATRRVPSRPAPDSRELAEALLSAARRPPAPLERGLAPVIMLRPVPAGVMSPSGAMAPAHAVSPTTAGSGNTPRAAATVRTDRVAGARRTAAADADLIDPAAAAAAVATHAGHLGPALQALLANAIAHGSAVRIRYTDSGGRTSNRVIEPLELDDHLLIAWCRMRADDRAFALDRIDAVWPV
ncbi:MAG TPA: helicase C-terminal domain-containing protein [Micromonosporaceae bacterium]